MEIVQSQQRPDPRLLQPNVSNCSTKNKLFKNYRHQDGSLRGRTKTIIIAWWEVSSVPIGRVVSLSAWEGVNLQVRLKLISGGEVLHLADGMIIHPIKALISSGSPRIHLTHPGTLVCLPVPPTHVSVVVSCPLLIPSKLMLLGHSLIIIIIIIILTSRPCCHVPGVGPIHHLHHNAHLPKGFRPHYPAVPTVAQVPHDLRSKKTIGTSQPGHEHPPIHLVNIPLTHTGPQITGHPKRDVAVDIRRKDGVQVEQVRSSDTVSGAMTCRQAVCDAPVN